MQNPDFRGASKLTLGAPGVNSVWSHLINHIHDFSVSDNESYILISSCCHVFLLIKRPTTTWLSSILSSSHIETFFNRRLDSAQQPAHSDTEHSGELNLHLTQSGSRVATKHTQEISWPHRAGLRFETFDFSSHQWTTGLIFYLLQDQFIMCFHCILWHFIFDK